MKISDKIKSKSSLLQSAKKRYLPSRSKVVKLLLEKAQDSAIQAVTIYNSPGSRLRTGSFIVLMCIAWTAMLHAYFESKKISYYYKSENGHRYVKTDGERRAWDLSRCLKEAFDGQSPVRSNLELFVKLRNRIEHRHLPALDSEIVGECQALVINFDRWLTQKFGPKYSLLSTTFIPIQLSRGIRAIPVTKSEEAAIQFVKNYRNLLNSSVSESQEYSFKAFLIPKIGNHRSSSDIAIEYVRYDPDNPGEMQEYNRMVVAIKERQIPIVNKDRLKPKQVVDRLRGMGHNVNMHWHVIMWRKHKVRPKTNSTNKGDCKTEFCVYDAAHGDYLYSQSWIGLLINDLTRITQLPANKTL